MIVALALPRMLDTVLPRTAMLSGAGLLTIVLIAAYFGPGYGDGLVLWLLLGAGASLVQTPSGLLLRRSSHPEHRPALFSAQFALSHACWLITYPLAGWLGASLGLDVTFIVMAVGAGAATTVAASVWPYHDPEELPHEHPELVHEHAHMHDEHHQHAGVDDAQRPHRHVHRHGPLRHTHAFVIDDHHPYWPRS
jgi:predicted MFS family arabinose efflux permease